MSAGHTPGPWRLEQTACLSVVADGHLGALAELRSRLDYGGMHPAVAATREANARLIAAAPELLEALRHLEMVSGQPSMRDDPVRVAARAAITNATGETA